MGRQRETDDSPGSNGSVVVLVAVVFAIVAVVVVASALVLGLVVAVALLGELADAF